MLLRRACERALKAPIEGTLFGLLRGCRPISSTPSSSFAAKRGGEDGENKDGEGDGDGKPTRAKREIISDEEVFSFLQIFCGIDTIIENLRLECEQQETFASAREIYHFILRQGLGF